MRSEQGPRAGPGSQQGSPPPEPRESIVVTFRAPADAVAEFDDAARVSGQRRQDWLLGATTRAARAARRRHRRRF